MSVTWGHGSQIPRMNPFAPLDLYLVSPYNHYINTRGSTKMRVNFTLATNNEIQLTQLLGRVDVSYDSLVTHFSTPDLKDIDGKVRAQWRLKFEDGIVATIYDWKESIPIEDVRDWHIGGHDLIVVDRIKEILELA